MPKPSIRTFAQAIDAYEDSLDRSNVRAIEAQLNKPLTNALEDAKRAAYLAIVEMCDYLNSWRGAADAEFLQRVQVDLGGIHRRIAKNAQLMPFAYLVEYARGFALRGQGQHQAAFKAFAKSTKLNKKFFRADAQKAAQQIYLDDLPEAKRLIKIAIRKTPSTSPAFANEKWTAARIEFFLGNYKAAISLLQESIDLNADLWYTLAYKCSAHAYLDQDEESQRLLTMLNNKFKIKTLQDVLDREKLNPSARSKSVAAGRRRLHGGLIKAGLQYFGYFEPAPTVHKPVAVADLTTAR